MDIAEVELLLVEPVSVAALSGNLHTFVVDSHLRGTPGLQAAVHQLHADAGGEPFTHRHVEGGGDVVAEVALTVVVTPVEETAGTDADKPVAAETVRLHTVLVVAVLHRLFGGDVLCQGTAEGHGTE